MFGIIFVKGPTLFTLLCVCLGVFGVVSAISKVVLIIRNLRVL